VAGAAQSRTYGSSTKGRKKERRRRDPGNLRKQRKGGREEEGGYRYYIHAVTWWAAVLRGRKGKSVGERTAQEWERGLSFRAILHWELFSLRAKEKKRYRPGRRKITHKGSRKRTSVRVHYRATDCAGKYRGKRQILYVAVIPSIAKEEGLWKAPEEE